MPDNSILNSTGTNTVCTDTKSVSLNVSEVCENDTGCLEYFILIEHAHSPSNSGSFSTNNYIAEPENVLIWNGCKYIKLNIVYVQYNWTADYCS